MSVPKGEAASSSNSNNSMPNTENMDSKDATILAQQLKMQLRGIRKEDHETIESYVKNLKSIANSLAAINNPISDQDLVLQLLAGLPSQYLLLKNKISSKDPLPNFSETCSMLYDYEKSLSGQSSTAPPPLGPEQSGTSGAAAENNNSNSSKSTAEMIHDIANAVTALASIGSNICKAFGWSETSSTSRTKAAPGNKGNKRNTRGRGGGRGNYNKRGGGPSNNNTNSRNSGRK